MPALVIDRITDLTPQHYINTTHLNIPDNIVLADPNFYDPSEVHILIGAGLFFNILSSGQIRGNKNQPILQQTKLGWIVSGPVPPSACSLNTTIDSCLLTSSNDQLQSNIENFWKIEENYKLSSSSKYTQKEEECETYIKSTTIQHGSFSSEPAY
uniref:Uncharacterized protein LOC114344569 n=1 Tax=Diabrotica virgifera virgifera TaxID=50390 RepID=A0A6P7GNJ2_DIAVI